MNQIKLLDSYLDKISGVYIYGEGLVGHRYFEYICHNATGKIKGFLVSDNKKGEYEGINIYCIDEVQPTRHDGVIVAMEKIPFAVKQKCFELFDENIFFNMPNMKDELLKWFADQYNYSTKEFKLNICSKCEPSSLIWGNDKGNLFRIYKLDSRKKLDTLNASLIQQFEMEYGVLKRVDNENEQLKLKKKIELYVVTTDLDQMNVEREMSDAIRYPIQAGRTLTKERKKCIGDDTGDNISNKNREYCETTALYWIWKNTRNQNYVGLEHYRRRMVIDDRTLTCLEKDDADMILPIPQYSFIKNIDFIKKSLVLESDWIMVKSFICEFDEEYRCIIEKYENSLFYFSCNIGLMKRTILDDYCAFAFEIANRLEQYYKEKNIVRYGDRYMGFIFEHLFSIYIMRYYGKMKIRCVDLEWNT